MLQSRKFVVIISKLYSKMTHANDYLSIPNFVLACKKREALYLTIFVSLLLLQKSEACKTTLQRLGSNISKLKTDDYRSGIRMAGKGKYKSCYAQLYNIFCRLIIFYICKLTLHFFLLSIRYLHQDCWHCR